MAISLSEMSAIFNGSDTQAMLKAFAPRFAVEAKKVEAEIEAIKAVSATTVLQTKVSLILASIKDINSFLDELKLPEKMKEPYYTRINGLFEKAFSLIEKLL